MKNIAYRFEDSLYLNITNRCPCNCTFCIRLEGDQVGDSDSLWLEHDPTAEEVVESLGEHDLADYDAVVFCGYGEPTENLDVLLDVCRYLKREHPETPVRLNTNGLADLINGKKTAPLLEGLVDIVSISLNAPTAERYMQVVQPAFGETSFDSLLAYAGECKRYVPTVKFTVVDVITPDEISHCKSLAAGMQIPLRVRSKQ